MDAQLKRGILDICVLTALLKEDSYGYKIIKDLHDVIDISESTLYPILRRLEKNGSLTVYTEEHNYRLRKMYRITPAGAVLGVPEAFWIPAAFFKRTAAGVVLRTNSKDLSS